MPQWWRPRRWLARAIRGLRPPLRVVHHEDYRLPFTSIAARTGLGTRRADFALWKLQVDGALGDRGLWEAPRASLSSVLRVHTGRLVESLGDPQVLGPIFGVEPWDVPVDAVLDTILRAVGGTVDAARLALSSPGPVLNLLGGFHHAAPDVAAGFCALNDVAVAVAVLRAEGFDGTVAVLDLDAHPPDGTAACFEGDPSVWLGSLSGSDWGMLPPEVDETVLPAGTPDGLYLTALGALLDRAPPADLWFVIAGGDVVAEDPIGALGLSEAGAAERDRRVLRYLGQVAQVWLPGGGYGPNAWRRLALTGRTLAFGRPGHIPGELDPLRLEFERISGTLSLQDLGELGDEWLTEADLGDLFGPTRAPRRFLGTYTPGGVQLALGRYGLLEHLERLGYRSFAIDFDQVSAGERLCVTAATEASDDRHTVLEVVVEGLVSRQLELMLPGEDASARVLFVHWFTLRHPLAAFRHGRAPLPGQEVPGLGLAREASELLRRVAFRVGCVAMVMRPAWYHVAVSARKAMRFVSPDAQARFVAIRRDLGHIPLVEATHAVAEGRVCLNGEPWRWEPALMAAWADPDRDWSGHEAVPRLSDAVCVTVLEALT